MLTLDSRREVGRCYRKHGVSMKFSLIRRGMRFKPQFSMEWNGNWPALGLLRVFRDSHGVALLPLAALGLIKAFLYAKNIADSARMWIKLQWYLSTGHKTPTQPETLSEETMGQGQRTRDSRLRRTGGKRVSCWHQKPARYVDFHRWADVWAP